MSFIDPSTHLPTISGENSQGSVQKNSSLRVNVGIKWQGNDCEFEDWQNIRNINLWRDFIPPEFESELLGLKKGDELIHVYQPGELVEPWHANQCRLLRLMQFHPPRKGFTPITPALGRFYPKDFFIHVPGIYHGNKFPCRIVDIQDESLEVDFNHPLSKYSLEMKLQIESITHPGTEHNGQSKDVPALLCDYGPGLQSELSNGITDFKQGEPYRRMDDSNDSEYYQQARLTPYWDQAALQQVTQHYQNLIPKQSRVLDLMAGVHSPMQESDCDPFFVCCAGLNQQELDSNPLCHQKIQLDVNSTRTLPFDNASFDAVLIHAAIEYVVRPVELLREISRILTPGGKILISFSNRSETAKVISVWSDAHEFERPGLVLSWLREAQEFTGFKSFSQRGRFRSKQDELMTHLLYSDPVFLVYAERK